MKLIMIGLLLGIHSQSFAKQSLNKAQVDQLLSGVKAHYELMGYQVTAIGKMSENLHPEMYHLTFHKGYDGCVQTITLEQDEDELKVNYLGDIDCR